MMFEKKTVEKSVPPVSIISMLFPDAAGAKNNFQNVKVRAIHGFTISSNGPCCPKIPMTLKIQQVYECFGKLAKIVIFQFHEAKSILISPNFVSTVVIIRDPRPNQFLEKINVFLGGRL